MAEFEVVSYLASKGIQGRLVSGGTELAVACFMGCGKSPSDRSRKMYVHVEDGYFWCHSCQSKGGSYLLQQFFGDDPRRAGDGHRELRRQILNEAADVGAEMLANNDAALSYLMDERGLSPETIVERKLGWVGNGWTLTGSLKEAYTDEALRAAGLLSTETGRSKDFFFRHLLIPYLHRGSVTQLRGRIWPEDGWKGGKYWTGPGVEPDIYARDELSGAEDVLVCEGEFDAMMARQTLATCPELRLRNFAVVALPGAATMKAEWVPHFEDVKRIHLGMDPDDAGKRAGLSIKELLGPRARLIALPEELPKADWSSWLMPVPVGADPGWHQDHPHAGHDWRDVQKVLLNATGRRLYTVEESGASWRAYKQEHPDGIKTGFTQLDDTILPGMLPGQLMVILARTGVGKSILLCNLCMNMIHRRVLFITLEMTREEIYERLRRIYLFWYPAATDVDIDEAFDKLMICDENKLSEKDFRTLIDEYVIEKGVKPEVVLLDYLGYYARGQRGNSQYEKVSSAIMQLKAEAKAHRVSIVTPAQVNRGVDNGRPIEVSDARDSGAIEETADFLLAIFRPDEAETQQNQQYAGHAQPTAKIRMQVLKSRHGGAGRVIGLQMDLLTLALVGDNTEFALRAQRNNHLHFRGKTWDDLRREQTAPTQMQLGGTP